MAFKKNPALPEVLERIDKLAMEGDEDLDAVSRMGIEPTVIQIRHDTNGYHVKSASAAAYDPIDKDISAREFSELPTTVKEAVLKDGFAMFVATETDLPATGIDGVQQLSTFCKCAAFSYGKEPQEGILVPAVRVSGQPCGMLFVGDDTYALQEKFAGMNMGDLPSDAMDVLSPVYPGGHGTFMYKKAGKVVVTEPLEVNYAVSGETSEEYRCTTDIGTPCVIRKVAGYSGIKALDDTTFVLPDHTVFLPINVTEASFEKSAEHIQVAAKSQADFVKVASNGTRWTISGDAVSAIPEPERQNVVRAQAAFVLGAVGLPQDSVTPILKQATRGTREVQVRYEIQDKGLFEKYAEDLSTQYYEAFNKVRCPGHSLVKAAAQAVEDVQTLDALLSLGFLSPQNIEVFINYIPELESALGHVSELLVASRLGLGLNEQALKNCMDTTDEIIQDLQFIANEGQSQFQSTTATQPNTATPFDAQAAPGAAAPAPAAIGQQAPAGAPQLPPGGPMGGGPAGPSTGGQPMQGGAM
jgi:hypothetical protein